MCALPTLTDGRDVAALTATDTTLRMTSKVVTNVEEKVTRLRQIASLIAKCYNSSLFSITVCFLSIFLSRRTPIVISLYTQY